MARFALSLLAALVAQQVAAVPVDARGADLSLSVSLPTTLSIPTLSVTLPSISIPTTFTLPTLSTTLVEKRTLSVPVGTVIPTGLFPPPPPPPSGFPSGPAPSGPAPTGAPKYPGGLLNPGN